MRRHALARGPDHRLVPRPTSMLLTEIDTTEECGDPDIRSRFAERRKPPCTRLFLAKVDGIEVGFLALTFYPNVDFLVLYELIVCRVHRQRGIGSRLLSEVEAIAVRNGYSQVHLSPEPLDGGMSKKKLVAWYTKRGYSKRAEERRELHKRLRRF